MARSLGIRWVVAVLGGGLILNLGVSRLGRADSPPVIPPDKRPSYAVEPAAEAFVGKIARTELAKDEVFVKALEDLARSDLSPAVRADAFALMQHQIGWLFVGATRQFPGMAYAQTQAQVMSTYIGYQEKLPKGVAVGPLLELARTARAEHPLRSSNALLLATILNHDAAKEAVRQAVDLPAIERAPVPAIDLHNLSLAATLTRDPKVVAQVVALLPKIESEESREDLVVATAIFQDEALRTLLENFVRAEFPARFDRGVQTALQVLVHGSPPDHFRAFYKSLGDGKDPKDVKTLRQFWDDKFNALPPPEQAGKTFLKIWDGFTFRLETSGGWLTFGPTFRTWITFQ